MSEETIVAVFDDVNVANAAEHELRRVVPASAISRHATEARSAATGTTAAQPAREPGFWSSLFGGEPDHSTEVYDRSLERGGVMLTVRATADKAVQAAAILERHGPVEFDEPNPKNGVGVDSGAYAQTGAASGAVGRAAPAGFAEAPQTLELAEESLVVGKRAVNRGSTRVRRFVVETPVEEQVTLRGETVDVQRRPVTDGRPVTGADFTEKTIEMAETDEEAVVSKTARVREEVTLNKTARDRVETVRDTVRREDVKVETAPNTAATGTAATTRSATAPARKPAI